MSMKKSQVKRKFEQIQKRISEERIIPNAIEITKKYGKYEHEMHNCHTTHTGKFDGLDYRGGNIHIDYETGSTMFGGGHLNIFYGNEQVFTGDEYDRTGKDYADSAQKQLGLTVKVKNLYVGLYKPGKWQRQLRLLAEKGPKKEKVSKEKCREKDLPESVISELRENFPIGDK